MVVDNDTGPESECSNEEPGAWRRLDNQANEINSVFTDKSAGADIRTGQKYDSAAATRAPEHRAVDRSAQKNSETGSSTRLTI